MIIVYSSNTGFTRAYAELLSEQLELPAYDLKNAPSGEEAIYLGWLMAGGIRGYKKAAGSLKLRAVCAVGMGPCGSRLAETRQANAIPAEIAFFTLQGGYAPDRLKGMHKFLMKMVAKSLVADLLAKENRTAEDEVVLALLQKGGSQVKPENLAAVAEWYQSTMKD